MSSISGTRGVRESLKVVNKDFIIPPTSKDPPSEVNLLPLTLHLFRSCKRTLSYAYDSVAVLILMVRLGTL
jgi:hypothetical protein